MPPEENGVGSTPQPQNNPVSPEPQIPPVSNPLNPPLSMQEEVANKHSANPVQQPTQQKTTLPPQKAGGAPKIIGILITLLLLGLIGVGVAFAAKFITNKSSDVDPQALLGPAISQLIEKEEVGFNTVVSVDIETIDVAEADLDLDAHVTAVNNMYISETSFETSGDIIITAGSDSLNATISYIFINNEVYVTLKSFELNINENTPQEFGMLAFVPIGEIKDQWIHIPSDELDLDDIEIADGEYGTISEGLTEVRKAIKLVTETELWRDVFTNIITYSEDRSTDDAFAYASNFTADSIVDYLTLIGLDYVIEEMNNDEEELQVIVDAMNSTTYFVNKDSQDFVSSVMSGYEVIDGGVKANIETTIEITDFKKLTAPTDSTNIEELIEEMFGFGF